MHEQRQQLLEKTPGTISHRKEGITLISENIKPYESARDLIKPFVVSREEV